jgi:hypothetical protein
MKKTVLAICISLALFSCKLNNAPLRGVQPERVLKKWVNAIKNLDYKRYAECEAYPKTYEEFLNMFKDFYFAEIQINISDEQHEVTRFDHDGDEYRKRELSFEGVMVNRKNHTIEKRIIGDVNFIKYIDMPKSKRGWLMFNRTLIEIHLLQEL